MIILTILIAVLAAAAAIFATLFFQDRKKAEKYEAKSDSLSKELSDLRCEVAHRETQASDTAVPLSRESIADFLRKEKAAEVNVSEEGNVVLFKIGEDNYYLDCSRLPRQMILRKGYDMVGADIHWDVLQRAANEVVQGLVMVKMHVNVNDSYDFMIVSPDHTVGTFRENFDCYLSIISDSERMLSEEYRKIMEVEHPDECGPEEQDNAAAATPEEVAMKMAQSADHNKVQS